MNFFLRGLSDLFAGNVAAVKPAKLISKFQENRCFVFIGVGRRGDFLSRAVGNRQVAVHVFCHRHCRQWWGEVWFLEVPDSPITLLEMWWWRKYAPFTCEQRLFVPSTFSAIDLIWPYSAEDSSFLVSLEGVWWLNAQDWDLSSYLMPLWLWVRLILQGARHCARPRSQSTEALKRMINF